MESAYGAGLILRLCVAGLLALAAGGCSKSEGKEPRSGNASRSGEEGRDVNGAAKNAAAGANSVVVAADGAETRNGPARATVEIPDDALSVGQAYPLLASAGLVYARLMKLPDGMLLWSPEVEIGPGDLEAEISRMPDEMRENLRKNAFFTLEQIATERLLLAEAREGAAQASGDAGELLRAYFEKLTQEVQVSEQEIEDFCAQNREMIGEAPLEQARPQIRQHLLRQKQREAVERHVRELGKRMPVALSSEWVGRQAELSGANPVDQARASGKPTLVNFGAKGCIPCDNMEPVREAVREKYEGRVNVVFVHVGNERALASRYGVREIPLLIFFDADGKEVFRHTGFLAQKKIEEKLAEMGVR